MTDDRSLARLAELAGIHHDYWDVRGRRHVTSPETARAILAAQGIAAATPADVAASLAALEQEPWREVLPPVIVARQGEAAGFPLHLPTGEADRPARWVLHREDGAAQDLPFKAAEAPLSGVREVEGALVERRLLHLPPLPCGYHRLEMVGPAGHVSSAVIVSPARCHMPPVLADRKRAWGISAQLYALRTVRNPGMGEYTDLGDLLEWAQAHGAASVGINPLHALFPASPEHASPYSPNSRQFLNPLYLDLTAIPDFAECEPARAAWGSSEVSASIAVARAADLVDYTRVSALKLPLLEALYASFAAKHLTRPDDARAAAYHAFVAGRGLALQRFALHAVLCETFGTQDWTVWPADYRDPASRACSAFAREREARLGFHLYLQWQCDLQLGAAAARGRAAGLGIGIYGDLAVSTSPDGADVWSAQDVFSAGARVGAPPDPLAEGGQEWGVVPMNPVRLRKTGYAAFIALLRANMRHFGALRIDHAMELERLFWIPRGMPGSAGAYMAYPVDDLIAILALESQRNQCLVIGEDLGTVPEGFRDRLASANLFSYRVLYFENHDGRFRQPSEYPQGAAAVVSTHDLPTLKGFWEERDLADRRAAGQFQNETELEDARAARRRDKAGLIAALREAGLLPHEAQADDTVLSNELGAALHRFLARSDAKLCMAQIDDLGGETAQANMPGTTDEYPNWRRRLEVPLEELAHSPRAKAILAALAGERPPQ